jgi:uncharacterized protein YdeI (BOF family)
MQKFLYVLPVAITLGTGGALLASDDGVNSPTTTRTHSAAPVVTSAAGVSAAQDHQKVDLHGRIVGVIDSQKRTSYVLSDNTGSVIVDSSEGALPGEVVFVGTAVEIEGEVDSVSAIEPKVEARKITILASVNGPPIQGPELYSD